MYQVVAVIYEPREDSKLLLSVVRKVVKPGMRVLDMDTGMGIVAILVAEAGAEVVACDINPEAIEVAKTNAKKAEVEITFLVSDLFNRVDGKFDMIIFNPPYLPKDEREDKESGINTTDNGVISRFLEESKDYLKPDGSILIVVSSLTPTQVYGEVLAQKKVPWETLSVVKIKK